MKIGVAEVDCTPPVGLPLMGHLRSEYASRGVHDPLMAKAVVFSDANGTKLAILSIDVCMVDRNQVAMMRRHISDRCDIPGENILIAATHIHSGPATMGIYAAPKAEEAAIASFLQHAAEAVVSANEKVAETSLWIGSSSEDRVSFNRRLRDKSGVTHMNWEGVDPASITEILGPTDPEVAVLVVEQEGTPRAAMVNFALHPAILDFNNWMYSGGWPGYMAEGLRKIVGKDFVTVFLNGCCGNVNHFDYTLPIQSVGFQATQRVGYMLAAAVKEAMDSAVPVLGQNLRVSSRQVPLERIQIGDEDHAWALAALESSKPSGGLDGLPPEHIAPTWIAMRQIQNQNDEVEVMALCVGDVGIAALPGEVFCELGLRIKNQSASRYTMVVELANDGAGYFPTEEAFGQGGYEVTPGATKYVPGSGERLTTSALEQLDGLFHA